MSKEEKLKSITAPKKYVSDLANKLKPTSIVHFNMQIMALAKYSCLNSMFRAIERAERYMKKLGISMAEVDENIKLIPTHIREKISLKSLSEQAYEHIKVPVQT